MAQPVLTNGLVAYYPFSGNASDATGLHGAGVVTGASLVQDRFGVASNAFGFAPGVNQNIELQSEHLPSGFELMTVSFWMKIESPRLPVGGGFSKYIPFDVVQSLSPVFAWDFNFVFQGNGIDFTPNIEIFRNSQFLGDYNLWSLFSSPQTATNWHQIVLTTRSNDFKLYLDGIHRPFTAAPDDLSAFERPPGVWYIGGSGGSFSGSIDEFRVYNRVLSPTEILELYSIETVPPPRSLTEGLLAYYPVNGNADDDSPFANHAAPQNAQLTADKLGRPKNAYDLTGANSYLSAPNQAYLTFANGGDFTISVWAAISGFSDSDLTPRKWT